MRSVLMALITAIGTLMLLDWAIFETSLLAPRMPIEDDGSPSDKLLLAERYRDAEMVHLGDSRILYGVHPEEVSEACRCAPGLNAAFSAADPRLTRIMANRLLEEVAPEVVVVGVSQWELSDAAEIKVAGPAPELVEPWRLAEFGVRLDQPAELPELLGQSWRLYRYRGAVKAALDPTHTIDERELERRGFDEYQGTRQLDQADLEARRRQWFSDFSVYGKRAQALQGLVADLRARNIGVLLVAPPLYPDFGAQIGAEVSQFQAAIQSLAAEHGAVFEDVSDPRRIGIEAGDFRDVVHLEEDGTEALSRHLGRVIRANFGAV